jgi:REP-associated tyrosine transposase
VPRRRTRRNRASALLYARGTPSAIRRGVTAPRQILPETSYLVTRRCSERRFFLRPSPLTNAIFLYVLAVAARRHHVNIHAFCVMSSHYHLIVTDPDARLPEFMQHLDSLVARATNASLGRWEGFWSSEASYSAVSHGAPEDIVRKTAYVLANPVSAGLVRSAREWPGLWTAPEQLGKARLTAPRPKFFFRSDGAMPESVELDLTLPPGFASPEEFQSAVAAAVRDAEKESHRKAAASGRRFLGRAAVLAQKPFSRPPSSEPRRQLSPRVAARDTWKRLEALTRLDDFLRAYRAAWAAMRSGVRDVVFPAGTYLLRVQHGVRCAAPS